MRGTSVGNGNQTNALACRKPSKVFALGRHIFADRIILKQSLICLNNFKRYRLMKYIVNAFWKDDTPINAEEAIDYMMIIRDTFDKEEHVLETIWYQIDEYTHI